MPAFQHNGHAIHFADEGARDGLPIVFSNSLGTDFRAWVPLLPYGLFGMTKKDMA